MPPNEFVGAGGPVAGAAVAPNAAQPGGPSADGSVDVPGAATAPDATAPEVTGTPAGGSAPASGSGAAAGSAPAAGSGGAVAGVKAASCAGFKNGPGITDTTINIGAIADRSGPVANTFKAAHDGMNAFVAYFNSTSSICGRKLKLHTYDSALSATGSNNASKAACAADFALVGSFSAFDSGGADVTAECGQPDIRDQAVEVARQQAKTTIQVLPIQTEHMFLQPWAWGAQQFGSKVKNAAYVYLNAGASGAITASIRKGTTEKYGYDWKKTIVVDITSVPNWNTYAQQLKSAGIEFVSTNLADNTPKLKAAFDQADYHPVFLADASAYGPRFISGPDAKTMEGVYSFTQTAMLEEASKVPEIGLMQTWLSRTGGDAGNITAMESWAAGRLFVQTALQLGGKLDRASLLAALRQVHKFDGNKIITPSDPGSGSTAPCATVVQVQGGRFVRITPYPYTCGQLS